MPSAYHDTDRGCRRSPSLPQRRWAIYSIEVLARLQAVDWPSSWLLPLFVRPDHSAPQAELSTLRLRLRPRTMADLEACLTMDLDPEVHRFIYGNRPPDRRQHRAHLRARIASGWPPQGGIWVVEWRAAPGFLGWCGLFPLEDSGLIEIGYRYVRGAWGQGIATEAGRVVLGHGFRMLGFDPIVAVTHPANLASQHVLEKIGLKACGKAFHYGQWLSFFELRRNEFLAADASKAPAAQVHGVEGGDNE